MRYNVGGDCHHTNQNMNIFICFMPIDNGAIAIAPYEVDNV